MAKPSWTKNEQELVQSLIEEGLTYREIGEVFGISKNAVQKRLMRLGESPQEIDPNPEPEIDGVLAMEPMYEPGEAWERAEKKWVERAKKIARRTRQTIRFPAQPIGITFIGDTHCGGKGVNYVMLRQHGELINRTPGLYCITLGDLLDNFIHVWAAKIRRGDSVPVEEEWALAKHFLSMVGPKMIAAVDGNHDAWTADLAGIDYFRETIAEARPGALYARDDLAFDLAVGDASWPVRVRHKWRGYSQWNPTHGIEKTEKWEHDFLIGAGGHTHTGAFLRTFNAAGETAYAVQVNTYKVDDDYPRREGFPRSNKHYAVTLILFPDGSVVHTVHIERAAALLETIYGGQE